MVKQWNRKIRLMLQLAVGAALVVGTVPLTLQAAVLESSEWNEETAAALAETQLQWLLDGRYEQLVHAGDAQVQQALTAESLGQAWEQTVGTLGAYEGVHTQTAVWTAQGITVVTILRFEQGGIQLTFVYDADKKLSGLWMAPASLEEEEQQETKPELFETELWKEELISVGEEELTGVVTVPKEMEDWPVVILVQGSGASDYNETIGAAGNQPFLEIAHALADQGIASVRYNKRFYEKPELAGETVTIYEEYLDDVDWLIDWAGEQSDSIYVLGHSQGAMSAPKIAWDHPEVCGIIMMAGSPRGLEEIILDQNRRAIEQEQTLSEEEKADLLQTVSEQVEQVQQLTEEMSDTKLILGLPVSYWRSLQDLKASEYAQELELPMLILQGEADFQVSLESDYQLWQELLKDKEQVEFHSYPGLNHLFMPQVLTDGRLDTAEYDPENQIEEQVLQDLTEWILRQEENRSAAVWK